MPSGLEWFAANQPISQAIDAVRALLLGEPVGNHVWITIVTCAAIAVVSAAVATTLLERKFK
jgi:ABC-type multidrug transport system permease subunit